MSVPEGQRSVGKLLIETKIEKLLEYVIDITTKYYLSPESLSPDSSTDEVKLYINTKWFAERLRSETLNCLTNIQIANKIRVNSDEDLYLRRWYQTQAEREVEQVLTIVNLMYRSKLIKSKRVKFIGTEISHIKEMIQNWRSSDKKRYTSNN